MKAGKVRVGTRAIIGDGMEVEIIEDLGVFSRTGNHNVRVRWVEDWEVAFNAIVEDLTPIDKAAAAPRPRRRRRRVPA